ncbi:MAG: WD40 repeat domain-containing protein, partial [Clostridiales bacterium]|nr:WD40 repeat domain-containing protein [Clostridiales bacterium]
ISGDSYRWTIEKSHSEGDVSITNTATDSVLANTGGFGGVVSGSSKSKITNCYTTSDIILNGIFHRVGGFAGYINTNSNIRQCYNANHIIHTYGYGSYPGEDIFADYALGVVDDSLILDLVYYDIDMISEFEANFFTPLGSDPSSEGPMTSIDSYTGFDITLSNSSRLTAWKIQEDTTNPYHEYNYSDCDKEDSYPLAVANQVASYSAYCPTIYDLLEFKGSLFAGTGTSGRLMKWNDSDDWIDVTGAPGSGIAAIYRLIIHNNKLFGCCNTGTLLEWNENDEWITRATVSDIIYCLVVNSGNGKLYGGSSNGKLYEWDGNSVWTEKADYASTGAIKSLTYYNNKIYGGLSRYGTLLEWNGTNAWIEKASDSGSGEVNGLVVFDEKLYGSASTRGRLFRWDDDNNWITVARSKLDYDIKDLVVYDGAIYAGTGDRGQVLKYDGIGGFQRYGMPNNIGSSIYRMNGVTPYNGKIYSCSTNSRLFEYTIK